MTDERWQDRYYNKSMLFMMMQAQFNRAEEARARKWFEERGKQQIEEQIAEAEKPVLVTVVFDRSRWYARAAGFGEYLTGLSPKEAILRCEFTDIGKAYAAGKRNRGEFCQVSYEFTPDGQDQADILFGAQPCWNE